MTKELVRPQGTAHTNTHTNTLPNIYSVLVCAWQCYFVVWTWREWHRALEEFLGLYFLTTLSRSLKNCSFQRIMEWNNTYTLTHIFCGNQRWLQLMRCARTKWPHRRKQRAPSELSLATHAHVVSLGVNTKGQTESLERKSHWKKRRRRKEVLRDSGGVHNDGLSI